MSHPNNSRFVEVTLEDAQAGYEDFMARLIDQGYAPDDVTNELLGKLADRLAQQREASNVAARNPDRNNATSTLPSDAFSDIGGIESRLAEHAIRYYEYVRVHGWISPREWADKVGINQPDPDGPGENPFTKRFWTVGWDRLKQALFGL